MVIQHESKSEPLNCLVHALLLYMYILSDTKYLDPATTTGANDHERRLLLTSSLLPSSYQYPKNVQGRIFNHKGSIRLNGLGAINDGGNSDHGQSVRTKHSAGFQRRWRCLVESSSTASMVIPHSEPHALITNK